MAKIKIILFLSISLFIAGCSCCDPFEPLNRKIFAFNMVIDKALFRPVARAYDCVVPAPIVCSIGNFFDNLDDVPNVANNILQFKFYDAWSDLWRLAFNTTFGVLGLFDVATCAGLPKHHQDFGLTLARYGFTCSPYLVVPFFGPTTIRDTVGWSVDWRYLSIWGILEPTSLRYGLYGLRLVHKRAALLAADKLIDESLDPYIFVRDAYLQKRDCDIKNLFPQCANQTSDKTKQGDAGDTFIAENSDSHHTDDTFVPDEGESQTGKTNAKTESKSSPDDTFVAP